MAADSKGQGANALCAATACSLRGQGATEYLVLLAVVLIVAIVTIALLGFFPGISGDAKIAEARTYWTGIASPMNIEDVQPLFTNATGQVCNATGTRGVRLVLQNNQVGPLILTNVSFGGAIVSFCPAGATTNAAQINLDTGTNTNIDAVIGTGYCATAGQTTDVAIKLTYNTQYLSGLVQTGAKNLIYKC